MNQQTNALRLADALEQGTYLLSAERNKTAAELRRLEAVNAQMLEALQKARSALAGGLWDFGLGQDEHSQCNAVIAECDAVIKAAEVQS
jgi:hypothetical protein